MHPVTGGTDAFRFTNHFSQLSKRVFPLCNLYICIYSLTNNFFLLFFLYSNTREKGKSRNNGEIRENWVTSTKGREC